MSDPDPRAVEVILEEVRAEADLHQRHWDAVDSKAATVGGFAAGVVALAVGADSWIVIVGQIAAGVALLGALGTLLPRPLPLLQIEPLREIYLGEPPDDSRLQVLNARVAVWSETRELLQRKARRLRHAVIALGFAAAILIAGTIVDRVQEGGASHERRQGPTTGTRRGSATAGTIAIGGRAFGP